LSINTAFSAPLLNASIPRLPVPAKISSTVLPGILPDIILKSAPFTLSAVGLVVIPFIVLSLRPPADPDITLKILIPSYSRISTISIPVILSQWLR